MVKNPEGHNPGWWKRHPQALDTRRANPMPKRGYSEDQYRRDRSERIATVLAVVLALVPWGLGMPVAYKWPLWGLSITSVLYLLMTTITSSLVPIRLAVNHIGLRLEWKITSDRLLSGLVSESVSAGTRSVTHTGRWSRAKARTLQAHRHSCDTQTPVSRWTDTSEP